MVYQAMCSEHAHSNSLGFLQTFSTFPSLSVVPSCFKKSTIVPIPKKNKITCLNNWRPRCSDPHLQQVFWETRQRLHLLCAACFTGPTTICLLPIRWSEWATIPHLPWSSTLVHHRAASSAHSCTPCTHTTVQPHTAPTSSSNLLTIQRWEAWSPTTMRHPTERRWVPWLHGVKRTTSHSTSTRPRSWWWITGDRAENTHPSPSKRHLWSG